MGNFYEDNEDLQYYVDEAINWDSLVRLVEHDCTLPESPKDTAEAVQGYRDVLSMVGSFVADEVDPVVARMDKEHMAVVDGEVPMPKTVSEVFEKINELELHGMCVPYELGGMNCPVLLYFLSSELLARADVSVMTHHSFHGAIAGALLFYSIKEGSTSIDPETGVITDCRFAEAIGEIARGEAWGSMDITEPDAGSDMAALTAKAELDEDGVWRITGQKIFITSGNGKYHIVIARSEPLDPTDANPKAGLDGLSLFLAKAYDDAPDGTRTRYVSIDRVEEKLGHHSSPTCAITFDRSPAMLVGKRGEGFKLMLMLMNNARVGVGFESLGACEAAYRMSKAYAADRRSMGKTIDRHELIADYLDEMRTDIQGIRAMAVAAGFHEEYSNRAQAHLSLGVKMDSQRRSELERVVKRSSKITRRLTPLLKFLAAEKAVDMARRAIQIHGGSGYTSEYGAEKLLRDSLVLPIYEGTTQIQSLMVMRDALKAMLDQPQEFVKQLAQARWRSLSSRDPLERRVAKLQYTGLSAQQYLLTKTATQKLKDIAQKPMTEWPKAARANWDPKRDFSYALLHAERLAQILADVAIVELLLRQGRKHEKRREVLERYLERAEPRCRAAYDAITTTGERIVSLLDEGTEPEQQVAC